MTKKTPRLARRSFGPEYECQKEWPENCFVQCGGSGIVFTEGSFAETFSDQKKSIEAIGAVLGKDPPKGSYRTAFFEAFPRDPSCFLRGEGITVEEAEEKTWIKWQKILSCPAHEFERKGRDDGYAYCRHCPYSGTFLEPTTTCKKCGIPTQHAQDALDNWYCLTHFYDLDYEKDVANEKLFWESAREARVRFMQSKAKYQLLVELGLDPSSKMIKDVSHLLVKPEVWDAELSKRTYKISEDGDETPDDVIASEYRGAFPRLFSSLLGENLDQSLKDVLTGPFEKFQANLESQKNET